MNTEKVKQTTDQITAAYALNLWTVSISQIIDYNDVNVLKQEYETIMNNLNLDNMPKDEALLDVIKEIMEEITFLRISEGDKGIVEREYQHKLKNAVWSAVPNVGAIFATANPVAMGVTLATQVGIGYMNYRRNRADYELENERTKWQIQRNRMEHLHALQKQLFETAWRMTDAHKFEDRFRLTETQISDYDKALMQANPVKRFNDLDAMKSNYEAYPAFWYQIGSTANSIYLNENDAELKEYYREKALDCFKQYDELNQFNLLRHDVITAAWALEYLELQGLSDKECPEEAKRLIGIAESTQEMPLMSLNYAHFPICGSEITKMPSDCSIFLSTRTIISRSIRKYSAACISRKCFPARKRLSKELVWNISCSRVSQMRSTSFLFRPKEPICPSGLLHGIRKSRLMTSFTALKRSGGRNIWRRQGRMQGHFISAPFSL